MATSRRTYFHGGVPGFRPGRRLLPASELKLPVPKYAMPGYDTDAGFVYVTTDRRLARSFAAIWIDVIGLRVGGGDLYEVTPTTDLLPDPDFAHTDGLCFATRSAVVRRVVEQGVKLSDDLTTYANTFTRWDDGTRMFDDLGYALPSGIARELGITAVDLRPLGRNIDFEQLHAQLQNLTTDILLNDANARQIYLDWHRQHSTSQEVQLAEAGFRRLGWA